MKKIKFNYTVLIVIALGIVILTTACNDSNDKEKSEPLANTTSSSLETKSENENENENETQAQQNEKDTEQSKENNIEKEDTEESKENDVEKNKNDHKETDKPNLDEEKLAVQYLPILYYHAVGDDVFEDALPELFVSPSDFRDQMQYLKENDYDVITFDDIPDLHKYPNPVIITFDDGYENNYTKAYPILKEFNFPAVIFIVNNFLDSGEYLKTNQIKEMSDLIHFESHSVTHSDLTTLDAQSLEKELTEPKALIKELTGRDSTAFAYPTGFLNQKVVDAVKSHYDYAVTNTGGLFDTLGDLYRIKRVYIPRNTSIEQFETRLTYGTLR